MKNNRVSGLILPQLSRVNKPDSGLPHHAEGIRPGTIVYHVMARAHYGYPKWQIAHRPIGLLEYRPIGSL